MRLRSIGAFACLLGGAVTPVATVLAANHMPLFSVVPADVMILSALGVMGAFVWAHFEMAK